MELLRFYAETYMRLARNLYDFRLSLYMDESEHRNSDKSPNDYELKPAQLERAKEEFKWAETFVKEIGLEVSALHVRELLQSLETLESSDVDALSKNIERELSTHFYIGISQEHKELYCESLKGWEDIAKAFTLATEDIEEMNKCLALCRYSAAVFHSLLVVEHGLVALGHEIGVTDPKQGWDATCRKLEKIVSDGRNAYSGKISFNFLEQINTCLQAMKLAWRNKVNHATGKPIVMGGGFAPYVAEDTISATRNFMRRLCEAGIKEDWLASL